MCRDVIIGVRHKCLDCPDFDLCSLCLAIQPEKIGLHSKSHSLFAIEEPGGLWVHTVFSGEVLQRFPNHLHLQRTKDLRKPGIPIPQEVMIGRSVLPLLSSWQSIMPLVTFVILL
ncbi:hypothetical protein BJV77DRAFT_20554 [Russula vinacea]|nr:hypothetical protein BJV77DRAFT_20554 [Russula vinacea]